MTPPDAAAGAAGRAPALPMFHLLVHGLALLHLGPGIAFAVLAFGCDPSAPMLGPLCARSGFSAFLGLTLAAWAVLVPLSAVWLLRGRRRGHPQRTEPPTGRTP